MELSKEMSEGRAFGRTNKTAMIVQEGNLAKRFFLRQSKLRRNEFAKLGIHAILIPWSLARFRLRLAICPKHSAIQAAAYGFGMK